MPTVHRSGSLRFVIFTDDHIPAHVHAIGPDGEAKIALTDTGQPPALVWVRGRMRKAEVRHALAEVAREQTALLAAWRRIHEQDAP